MEIKPVSKFLKVECSKCKNHQTIFNKSASGVNCLVCGALLAKSTGGKARVKSKVIQTM
ncbi:MAG TPA: 30S ribosomal protein S27e [archaeon]|nr:30S ribosomal protein S27e [archaeon]